MRMKSGQVLKLSSSWVCVSPHLLQRELFGRSCRKALQTTHTDIASIRAPADVSSHLLMLNCRTPAKQPQPSNRLSRYPSQTFSSLSCRNCERKSLASDVFVKGRCYASADEWGATSPSNECSMSPETPSVVKDFFCGYLQSYDPSRQHASGSYSYNRQDDHVILGFDALQILFQAFYLSRQEKEQPGQGDIQQAIQQINICNPYQGVTGQIAFGPAGDPIHKAILILRVSANHTTHLIQIAQGQLKVSKAC